MTEEQKTEAQPEVPLPYSLEQLSTTGLDALVGPIKKPLEELSSTMAHAVVSMCPSLSMESAQPLCTEAIREAAAKHPDFAAYAEGMVIASLGILPYPYRTSWAEYVEALYCIAKHTGFMQAARWRSVLSQSTGAIQ